MVLCIATRCNTCLEGWFCSKALGLVCERAHNHEGTDEVRPVRLRELTAAAFQIQSPKHRTGYILYQLQLIFNVSYSMELCLSFYYIYRIKMKPTLYID